MSTLFKYKKPEHHEVINRLIENPVYKDRYILANTILAIMVVANAEVSLASSNAVDMYLDQSKDIWPHCIAKDSAKLQQHVYDALRASPPFAGVFRVAAADKSMGGREFKLGDRLFLDVFAANQQV